MKKSPIPVWRKFEVPSNISLAHLGELILNLFGWDGYHLNCFYAMNTSFVPKSQIDDDFGFWREDDLQEKYSIQDILFEKGKKIIFEYDFGDAWEHEITLSRFDSYNAGEKREIVYIDGKGACPPEDCGGVWGYSGLLETLNKLKVGKRLNKEEKEYLEWAGWDETYDPDYVDITECQDICRMFSK